MNLFQKLMRGTVISCAVILSTMVVGMAANQSRVLTAEEITELSVVKGPGAELMDKPIIEIASAPEDAINTTTIMYEDIVESGESSNTLEVVITTAEQQAKEAAEEAARKAAEEEARRQAELESRKQYAGKFTLTAYCSCKRCCGRWSPEVTGKPSTTESGTHPVQGRTVAVDKHVIPLGTHIMINGHEYIAEDTGSAVDGNHVDVYFSSHAEAKAFGMKKGVDVYILK